MARERDPGVVSLVGTRLHVTQRVQDRAGVVDQASTRAWRAPARLRRSAAWPRRRTPRPCAAEVLVPGCRAHDYGLAALVLAYDALPGWTGLRRRRSCPERFIRRRTDEPIPARPGLC